MLINFSLLSTRNSVLSTSFGGTRLLALYTQFGPWSIPTFRLTVGIAILLSLLVGLYRQQQRGRLVDVYSGALVLGIIGARLFHVALNWDYFTDNQTEMWVIGAGGLDWHGALLGGLLGASLMLWLQPRIRMLLANLSYLINLDAWLPLCHEMERGLGGEDFNSPSFNQLLDSLAPALPLIGLGGWVGCLAAGCGYGREVDSLANYPRWMSSELVDVFGIVAPRFNTPYFGIVLSLLGFLLVLLSVLWRWRSSTSQVTGQRFWWLLALMSVGMFIIGFYRADHTFIIVGLRADQVLDVMIGLWSLVLAVRVRGHKRSANS